MFKRILAICGFVLFLGGIGLGVYLIKSYLTASIFTSSPQQIGCSFRAPAPNSYALNLSVSDSTISTDQTDALTVDFTYCQCGASPGHVQNVPMTIALIGLLGPPEKFTTLSP